MAGENGEGEGASKAKSRLNQLSSQLSPPSSSNNSNTHEQPKQRRRKQADNGPPADYADHLGTIKVLKKFTSTPPAESRGYIRQKEAGKLWVRERVEQLLDDGSLREVGSITGTVEWAQNDYSDPSKSTDGARKEQKEWDGISEKPVSFTPSNSIQGFGRLGGRNIVFSADDYSLRAGHADGAIWAKTLYLEKLALTMRLPMIKLVDGSSGGGSVTTIKSQGFSYVPPLVGFDVVAAQLNAGIPNLGAVLGPAIGLGAARVTMCHFSVMAGDIGSLFNAGPKVVAGATFEEGLTPAELGGPDMHCRNGTIDNLARDETDAFHQLRTMLSFLPNSGSASLPPTIRSSDAHSRTDEALRSVIPRNRNRMYDVRRIIVSLADKESFFEIGSLWGTTVIVGLARLAGRPVGVVANNPESGGGALDAAGSQKLSKHLKLCDVMNLPVVQLVDVPGYAVGTVAERSAAMRHGVALAMAYYSTTIPIFSVVTRRCYGVAGGVMVDSRDPHMRVAWPSGDWGSLPLSGGIEASHSHQLKELARKEGPEAAQKLYKDLETDYLRLMNPVRTANAFGIEEIIDPSDTRSVVCGWTKMCYDTLLPERLEARKSGRLHVQYA